MKIKNILIAIPLLLLLVAGAAWIIGRVGTNNAAVSLATSTGILTADMEQYDFGTVSMAAGKVSHRFAVTNPGTEPITVTKLSTSCMCTTALLIKRDTTLGPYGMEGHGGYVPKIRTDIALNETVTIEAVFDPTAHGPAGVGKIDRAVMLENNTGTPLVLRFAAMVTP